MAFTPGWTRSCPHILDELLASLHSSVGAVIDVPFQSVDALHEAERREAISRDISHRLRRVCVNLTAPDFLQLVNSMVAMQLRGELRKNHFFRT